MFRFTEILLSLPVGLGSVWCVTRLQALYCERCSLGLPLFPILTFSTLHTLFLPSTVPCHISSTTIWFSIRKYTNPEFPFPLTTRCKQKANIFSAKQSKALRRMVYHHKRGGVNTHLFICVRAPGRILSLASQHALWNAVPIWS